MQHSLASVDVVGHVKRTHKPSHCHLPALPCPVYTPAAGLSDTFEDCSTVFRFYWFAWAFTTVVLLGLGVATATRLGLHYTRGFWVGLISVCIYINMVTCEAFLGYEKIYSLGTYWWLARWRAVVAGAIINVIWLIFLLMAVGTE